MIEIWSNEKKRHFKWNIDWYSQQPKKEKKEREKYDTDYYDKYTHTGKKSCDFPMNAVNFWDVNQNSDFKIEFYVKSG